MLANKLGKSNAIAYSLRARLSTLRISLLTFEGKKEKESLKVIEISSNMNMMLANSLNLIISKSLTSSLNKIKIKIILKITLKILNSTSHCLTEGQL